MAKKDGIKIPKRVGGVKLPKQWRKRGEALIAQAQSPAGRTAIAQGVSVIAGFAAAAAASAAAKSAAPRSPATPTAPTPLKAVPPAPPPSPSAVSESETPGDAIAKAVTAGIDAALGRLFVKR